MLCVLKAFESGLHVSGLRGASSESGSSCYYSFQVRNGEEYYLSLSDIKRRIFCNLQRASLSGQERMKDGMTRTRSKSLGILYPKRARCWFVCRLPPINWGLVIFRLGFCDLSTQTLSMPFFFSSSICLLIASLTFDPSFHYVKLLVNVSHRNYTHWILCSYGMIFTLCNGSECN